MVGLGGSGVCGLPVPPVWARVAEKSHPVPSTLLERRQGCHWWGTAKRSPTWLVMLDLPSLSPALPSPLRFCPLHVTEGGGKKEQPVL